MKHSAFTLGAMLAATFALSSCNESLSPLQPTEGVPFEISTLLTKTANDGLNTVWASGDAINLFHAEAGATTYISDGQFTVDDVLTGVFSGTLASALEEGKSYDWYANYPYNSKITTPAITSGYNTWVTIGGTSQTQTGNGSRAHLAGTACPLYGVAKSVASDVKPAIEMKQLASVVAIKVTNTLEDALTVSSVSFTSSEDIVGTYYIDYSGETPVYTLRGDSYVSKTATLTVTDGTAIEQNSSAVFYIALKPHKAESGSTLKISVNGVEKTLTLTKDVTFTAGHIKTLQYEYDKASYVVLPWSIDGTGGSNVWTNTPGLSQSGLGTDYAASNSPYLVKFDDSGDYVQVRYDSPATSLSFNVKMLGGKNTSTITVCGSLDGTTYSDIQAFTVSGSQNDIKSFTTSNAINSDYRYVRIVFTKKGSNVGLGKVSIKKESTDPVIEADNVLDVSARGLEAEILTYSITNPVTGTAISATCDGTVVTEVVAEAETILYNVSKNTTGAAREGNITLTYGSVTKDVKVSQLADTFKTSVEELILDAEADATKTMTVTSDFDWIANGSDGAGFSFSPDTYTWENDGKQTVTVKATSANASKDGTITLGTITFSNCETEATKVVTVKQKSSYVANTATITFNQKQGSSETITWTSTPITVVAAKGEGSNNPYEHAKDAELRFYAKNTLTISGATITKVEFTFTTAQALTPNEGTYDSSNKIWKGNTTNLILTNENGSQAKIKSIVVTYE